MAVNTDILFSSKSQVWATRPEIFEAIRSKFDRSYNLDPCAFPETAKCDNFITPEMDMFKVDWAKHFDLDELRVFMNPEYGLAQQRFIDRMIEQIEATGGYGDVLIPSRTDTRLFHDTIVRYADTTCYARNRAVFGSDEYWEWVWSEETMKELNGKDKPNDLYGKVGTFRPAPFGSLVVSFTQRSIAAGRKDKNRRPVFDSIWFPKAIYKGIMSPWQV